MTRVGLSYKMYDMTRRINARLDEETGHKLEAIERARGWSVSEVVRFGIELVYARERAAFGPNVLKLLEDEGFVGCASRGETFSEDYKRHLAPSLDDKT